MFVSPCLRKVVQELPLQEFDTLSANTPKQLSISFAYLRTRNTYALHDGLYCYCCDCIVVVSDGGHRVLFSKIKLDERSPSQKRKTDLLLLFRRGFEGISIASKLLETNTWS